LLRRGAKLDYFIMHVYRHGGADYIEEDDLSASNLHRKPVKLRYSSKMGES
jgi:hypothetical protein